jgi:hypothetical protein
MTARQKYRSVMIGPIIMHVQDLWNRLADAAKLCHLSHIEVSQLACSACCYYNYGCIHYFCASWRYGCYLTESRS